MTEAFLQYIWQHQLLEGKLCSTDGREVVVHRAGEHNTDAGPDFFNSHLTIDGVQWAGNVEVHVKSSDWKQHRHSSDKSYNNVVLHVVYEHDVDVVLENGQQVVTLEVKDYIPQALWDNYEALLDPPQPMAVPCEQYLSEVPSFLFSSYLDRLMIERLERKCGEVKRLLEDSKGSWEQCCYWLLAHYFGGKTNAFPFELTAKAIDPKLLARWRDNPLRIEALLMGQAGMLEDYFEDDYPRLLQADFAAIKGGAGLTPIAGYLWKYFRLRPNGFPTIRLSQFAQLMCKSENLFSHLLETPSAKDLQRFFDVEASAYWKTHYRFDQSCSAHTVRAGKAFVNTLIINAWTPLLFVYGTLHGQQRYKDQAIDILRQLPAEDNHIIRDWAAAGVQIDNAASTQALIQLHNEYCQNHRCLECQIGYRVIRR